MFKKVSLSTIFQIGILVVIGIMFCMTGNILGGVSGDNSTLEYDHNMDTEDYHVEVTHWGRQQLPGKRDDPGGHASGTSWNLPLYSNERHHSECARGKDPLFC